MTRQNRFANVPYLSGIIFIYLCTAKKNFFTRGTYNNRWIIKATIEESKNKYTSYQNKVENYGNN